jgi:hypothetical protein
MQEESYALKATASARPIPPAPCRCPPPALCLLGHACAVFHFLLIAVDRVIAARTHVFLRCFTSDHAMATPSCRHYRLAAMPVTVQVILSAIYQNRPFLVNTCWDKRAELLRRTINVLCGKNIKNTGGLLNRHDVVVSTKLLVKFCRAVDVMAPHSNDDTTGDNALKHFKMLPRTVEREAAVTRTAMSRTAQGPHGAVTALGPFD